MSKEVKRFIASLEGGFVEVIEARDYDALLEENKLLSATQYGSGRMQALRDERDALLAERNALKRAMDRQVPLHDAIQRAAGDLPEGWEIRLCVEHHAGWVELIGPDGTEEFATNDERLDYTVIDALEHALQGEQP